MERENNKVNPEGKKEFRRMGKDKDDNFYMFGKIRNLENIIFLNEDEIKKCKTPVELQLKVDTVKPTLESISSNFKINDIHNVFENYKYLVENSKNFRSIKDKFLGLPFMLNRHKQYPEPVRGTWQFDVYETIFGEPYDYKKNIPESEEKINKFNYHLFLHPSVIAKYDTNSEEFDMYLRKLNIESKTHFEKRVEQREYFCKSILPLLNLSNDPADGYEITNYILNKNLNGEYENYIYDSYSNQKEEALFREAEEYNYMNKNQPFVERTQYSTIDKSRIGLKASDLNELLENPTKRKNLRKAMEKTYLHYESTEFLDKIKYARYRSSYVQTMLDNDLEMPKEYKEWEDIAAAQNTNKELSEDEAAMRTPQNDLPAFGGDKSNFPVPKKNWVFYYDSRIDWNDYQTAFPTVGFVSPKKNRYELYHKNQIDEGMILLK